MGVVSNEIFGIGRVLCWLRQIMLLLLLHELLLLLLLVVARALLVDQLDSLLALPLIEELLVVPQTARVRYHIVICVPSVVEVAH